MSQLYVSAGIQLTEGTEPAAAIEMLQQLARATVDEPGCISFEIRQNLEDPRKFTLWECWTDPDALAQHFKKEHTKAAIASGMTEIMYVEKLSALG